MTPKMWAEAVQCPDCYVFHNPKEYCVFACQECGASMEYDDRRSYLKCPGCGSRREPND